MSGRYPDHAPVGPDGWSDWITPVMSGYRAACCDCGLVHEFQFQVLRHVQDHPNGTWEGEVLSSRAYRVEMRLRRHNRATGQIRRHLRRVANDHDPRRDAMSGSGDGAGD